MNDIIKTFTVEEKNQLAEAIERAFILQGKSVNDKIVQVFLSELIVLSYSFDEIMRGLNAMKDLELREIKISIVKGIIYEHSDRAKGDKVEYTDHDMSPGERQRLHETIEKLGLKIKTMKKEGQI